ncbi:uncharacterized protein with ParB-like and HNH nuclease domain [Methylorubrum rhodesianum]|uniref:DUF262 domain-containing protein n=1 Tax=Methylorubrum TaxID=2282523 RepID=UPI0016078627|nr:MULTISPECIES: DUF262 domain-containing protein [Methylorubrum]MBB5761394.1 uncharacterized protein with ParB-like and HNH nuclease domain [Methylorubrum rhodesianum]MBI1687293.1 DUF262 domain-containing protein [Methylorubrum sp. DB1722]
MRETFSADPTVVFLTSVLDDLSTGRIRIPRFQRPLVWTWNHRREFLESIFAGLPIGALMIWATSNEEIGCYDSLGPHRLPPMVKSIENRYLMDGVQRISTLFGALRATESWKSFDETNDFELRDFVVYADLDAADESERFKRSIDIRSEALKSDPTRYLPLNIILQSKELLKFQRALANADEKRIDMADEVAAAFRSYKIPLITLNSASLEVVTKSFERINSRGADMSELHMLNALSYSPKFDLLKLDNEYRSDLLAAVGWEKVDTDVVLRCIKANLKADIYKTNPDEVSRRLKEDPQALYRTFNGLRSCAIFFDQAFGITDPALVPYRIQIVAIATALSSGYSDHYRLLLEDWVWLTTYSELFGGSGRQSESAIGDFLNYVETGLLFWSLRQQPTVRSTASVKSDFRAARVKALMLALAYRSNQVESRSGSNLIREFGAEAFHFLALPNVERGDPGGRFLINPEDSHRLRAQITNCALSDDVRERHIISDYAIEAARLQDYKEFARRRALDIFEFEKKHILKPLSERLEFVNMRVIGENDQDLEGFFDN